MPLTRAPRARGAVAASRTRGGAGAGAAMRTSSVPMCKPGGDRSGAAIGVRGGGGGGMTIGITAAWPSGGVAGAASDSGVFVGASIVRACAGTGSGGRGTDVICDAAWLGGGSGRAAGEADDPGVSRGAEAERLGGAGSRDAARVARLGELGAARAGVATALGDGAAVGGRREGVGAGAADCGPSFSESARAARKAGSTANGVGELAAGVGAANGAGPGRIAARGGGARTSSTVSPPAPGRKAIFGGASTATPRLGSGVAACCR
jgi:hypothetical protein